VSLLLVFLAWLVALVQVIYLARYLYAFREQPSDAVMACPPVSVVVCAHDEEANLRELVPLLLAQDYPDFEVIVVEDRCNDGTYDYLLEATRQHPKLKMVRVKFLPEHVTGKKYAVTLGVKAAVHDWVLLTDADCRPSGNQWIRSMAARMTPEKQIVIGYSPYKHETGYLNAFIRFESLITATQFIGRALLGSPYMGTGRNLAYRKSLFLDNKGFHGHLSVTGGDDDLFVNRHATAANTAVCLGEVSLMRSIPERSWGSFLHQKRRHLSVGKFYRRRDRWSLGLFGVTWILSWAMLPAVLLPQAIGYGAWAGLVVRITLLTVLVHRASRRMGEPFEAWKTPLLDFNYAIYYLGTGLSALASKRIRWKN
jgi:cellulose synthase/poly-beta-1,6-N-acetylglucosamine synthase-like glycosyltransferase